VDLCGIAVMQPKWSNSAESPMLQVGKPEPSNRKVTQYMRATVCLGIFVVLGGCVYNHRESHVYVISVTVGSTCG